MNMTLEQLMMYLWHGITLRDWMRIVAAILMIIGVGIYLQGKGVMRANSYRSISSATCADGSVITSESNGIGNGYADGKYTAKLGLFVFSGALLSFISSTFL